MANLYVANLPEGIDDQSFKMLFEGSGILSAVCSPEKKCGFVKYTSKEEAQSVIESMNGYDFGGTQLIVGFAEEPKGGKGGKGGKGNGWNKGDGQKDGWNSGGKGGNQLEQQPMGEPQPSDNLYVKGLPAAFDQATCEELFNGYGKVMQCRVMNHGNLSSALIRMESFEMAQWILENLDSNIPEGLASPIEVRYADTPAQKAARMQQFGGKGEQFGTAKGEGKGRPSPYGEGVELGEAQVGNSDPFLPPQVKEGVDIMLANMGAKGIGKGKKNIPGDQTNLYVKDLPGTADELYVYRVFSPFGSLESINVKPSPDGSWAIAFVKYRTEEEAANAIQGLTNCLLPDGSMLKLAVKTSR